MGKTIGAVLLGYVTMFALVFVTFGAAYLVLGAAGSFQPGTYQVSGVWIALSIVLGLVAAVAGGRVCVAVARDYGTVKVLAGVVLVVGLTLALLQLGASVGPSVRPPDTGTMEAMQNARQPTWLLFVNPVIGALGVLYGGSLRRSR